MFYPKVSIVIPSYNHARFIEAALLSVEDQTYENLEIILVDDGSSDGSLAAIERAAGRIRRGLRVVRQRNRGAAAAINRGLKLAGGKYINILNSDDLFAPERVAYFVERLEKSGAKLAFSGIRCIDENGAEVDASNETAAYFYRKQAEMARYPSVGFALLDSNVAISSGNIFAAKEIYATLHGFRPYLYCHDWDFLLRALCLTEPLYIDTPMYYYRLHGGNTFRKLAHRAKAETTGTLRKYFGNVRGGRLSNADAPSPRRWPGYFEEFVRERGYQPYWGRFPRLRSLWALCRRSLHGAVHG
ncbi:glycosyltransferase [Desulfatiglans anilini]|uniref:glycosyltransferase n=1 Tax=Desulfatiglans anilini TaxID=90728 RepID=UPI0003F58A68|nr:glycosyltransferase [Desulfatiglans anilini]